MTAVQEPLVIQQHRLQAWNNYVIVKLNRPRDTVFGQHGIVLPSFNQDVPTTGVVDSVGPDVTAAIHAGDLAAVPPYGIGLPLTWDHTDYMIILDYDILGVWPADTE